MVTFNSTGPGAFIYTDSSANPLEEIVKWPGTDVVQDVGYTLLAYLCKKKTKLPQWEYLMGYHHLSEGSFQEKYTKLKTLAQEYLIQNETSWMGYKIVCFQISTVHHLSHCVLHFNECPTFTLYFDFLFFRIGINSNELSG